MSTWMVVEDEPDIYEVLLAMFEMWGIDGVAFVDGEEASAWIEEVGEGRFKGELPELALLDIRLPGLTSGPEVGAKLRKCPPLSQSAIVLFTAYRLTPEEEKVFIAQADADKLMYKPLPRLNELKVILEEVIAARRAKASVQNPKP
ncbi:MAG: response regulator transcription factor [Anaerolineae bacterium]|nr:response regulator transcription factor [Anaerolineae bacterium]